MKKALSLILSLAMLCSLAACGGGASSSAGSASGSGSPAASSIAVCLASEPDTIDPALNSAVDGATLVAHLFSGLAKWAQDADGNLVIVADAAEELVEGVVNADGTVTYTYTLRDGLKWSDGKDVTAADYEFAWKRAASVELAADYGYMFEVVDGYADVWAETPPAGAELNVHAKDAKTLEVTLANAVAYWNELLAFPTYYPVREDVVSNEAWATDPSTYVCNGPYTMTGWEHNSLITLEKNPNYVDADSITMEKIEFYLSDDANNMLTNFKNSDWLLIDDVPTNEIANLKVQYPDEFVVAGQIGTYYVNWNVNQNLLPEGSTLTGVEAEAAEAEIREAIGLLYDRNYIVEEIGQAGQVPASSFVAMGMTNPDGTEFYKTAGGNSYPGYYDVSVEAFEANFAQAVETLKKYYDYDEASGKFTNAPSLTYLYNTSEGHKAIGEYLAAAMASVGITMNLENQEWNTFLNTRKNGDYSVARNGWLADYNDPICFLDMWITASGNNDVQFGKENHASLAIYDLDLTDLGYDVKVEDGTWAETYDVIIPLIKTCTDNDTRYALMHKAEDLLMSTGAIVPLYFYTDIYMVDDSVEGFFANPLGYKYFYNTTVNGSDETISVCLSSEPDTIDPALNSAVDGATLVSHLFAGLAKWTTDEAGNLAIAADCATELPEGVANDDGTITYTYTLKEGLKWSDGQDLTAKDFEFAWKRAASSELGADYGYMFEVIKGFPDELAVEATDDVTLTVTLNNAVAYWNELLAFPTYFPVREDVVADEGWATEAATYVSNGAYTMTGWEHNSTITLTKNENYHDADSVVMNEIKFYLSDDANNMLTNFKNGTWQLIDDVPTNEIAALKVEYPEEFVIAGQIGTYYVCWNINEELLPE